MKNKPVSNIKYIETVGRRREATARVRLYPITGKGVVTVGSMSLKKGDIVVNNMPAHEYFPGELNKKIYSGPLTTTSVENIALIAVVTGGGKNGQLTAVVHGISRALDEFNTEYRPLLKKRGFLTRDPRIRERRKVGLGGRARAKKSSPKR
jgi:small subunit ribosomal protein S9